jgi:hypothetical protein
LLPSELPFYAAWKCGKQWSEMQTAIAINHHHKRNRHHWEYWVAQTGHFGMLDNEALDMPNKYLLEMLADWLAVARVADGRLPDSLKGWSWFQMNSSKMNLTDRTRFKVRWVLQTYFERYND